MPLDWNYTISSPGSQAFRPRLDPLDPLDLQFAESPLQVLGFSLYAVLLVLLLWRTLPNTTPHTAGEQWLVAFLLKRQLQAFSSS